MADTDKSYEDLLGDSLERAMSEGCSEPDVIADALARYGPPHPEGLPWTDETLVAELARLAA